MWRVGRGSHSVFPVPEGISHMFRFALLGLLIVGSSSVQLLAGDPSTYVPMPKAPGSQSLTSGYVPIPSAHSPPVRKLVSAYDRTAPSNPKPVIAVMPQPPKVVAPQVPQGPRGLDAALFAEANAVRRRMGLRELSYNPQLTAAATDLANCMANTGRFDHNADGRGLAARVQSRGYRYSSVSENIAMCSGNFPGGPVQTFFTSWLRSPGHRKNLLDPSVTETGIVGVTSSSGRVYSVQVFGRPSVR